MVKPKQTLPRGPTDAITRLRSRSRSAIQRRRQQTGRSPSQSSW